MNNIKGSLKVIFVDSIGLIMGIINGFMLPTVLSLTDYSIIKTFSLYIGYAGVLHLGFSDGVYLIMGGKNLDDIGRKKISGYFLSMLKVVITMEIILFGINMFIRNEILSQYLLYSIPFQIVLFFSLIFRSTANFGKYSLIKNCTNILMLITTLIVVIFVKDPYVYIYLQIVSQIILALICFLLYRMNIFQYEKIKTKEFLYILSAGFTVLLANTVSNLIISLDRWIVKLNFSTHDFAYYSFGTQMMSLFLMLISSVGIIFYPYLSNVNNKKNNNRLKEVILTLTLLTMGGSFVFKIIVLNAMPQYTNSLNVLYTLILAIPFISVINIVLSNLYKVNRKTKQFSIISIGMLLFELFLILAIVHIFNSYAMVSIGVLITYMGWYVIAATNKNIGIFKYKDMLIYFYCVIVFMLIKYFDMNGFLQLFTYLILVTGPIYSCYRNSIQDILVKLKR